MIGGIPYKRYQESYQRKSIVVSITWSLFTAPRQKHPTANNSTGGGRAYQPLNSSVYVGGDVVEQELRVGKLAVVGWEDRRNLEQ